MGHLPASRVSARSCRSLGSDALFGSDAPFGNDALFGSDAPFGSCATFEAGTIVLYSQVYRKRNMVRVTGQVRWGSYRKPTACMVG